ncbi:MAG: N-acetylmuramoyl-L-alanine amidase CwlD [Paraclostridium sp.]|uniref:N-acetylmuramoyl-L-alanine amidase CwlD n=1 Tax=Paraclostridium sp. TaxID=2023273 RepID=UPI003F3FF1A9
MKYIKCVSLIGALLCCLSIFIFEVKKNSQNVMSYMPATNKVIMLDAGHGGIDPGALNEDKDILEKDINLQITLKLRELLEASGCLVLLTREEDVSLYEEGVGKTTRQKYNENLKNRKKLIKESGVDAFISIHLNKFEQSKYYGAQTFYPEGQDDSKLLSKFIQEELKRVVDKSNQREVKPSKDIYLLKDNEIPSVLIECGFLSNEKETDLLNDEKYQEKIAWAIYAGMQKYFGANIHN